MVLKIGITFCNFDDYINNPNKKYCNGFRQNILFIYNYFNNNDNYSSYIITSENTLKTNLNSEIPIIDANDIDNLITLDVIINVGFCVKRNIVKLRESKVKLIKLVLGNDCVINMEDILYTCYKCGNNTRTYDIINAKNKIYDEIWISPHFEYSIDYWKYIHQTEKVFSAPYIWDSMYMDAPYTDFNHQELNVGVFESNLGIIKNCLIPIIICDKAKDIINKAYILNSQDMLKSEHFQEFIKISELVASNRIKVERRHRFKYVMDTYCNVVVSFTENCDLNYVSLECFYLGIPLVHNSKMLKDWGYYYEGYDVQTAVRHLKCIKESFNRSAYIDRHKQILFKYSMQNPEYIQFFKDRLTKDKDMENKFPLKADINNYDLARKDSYLYDDLVKKNIIKNTKLIGTHPNHNFSCDIDNEEIIKISNEVKVINNNDIASFVISVSEKRKSEMKNKLGNNIYFIETEKFPENCSQNESSKILGYNHINCWKKALNMNLDEAFIFEDDVIFIKNWRNIINEFINIKKPDIIRFDSLPWRHLSGLNDNQIAFYKETEINCTGGYYMTKQAMEYCIEFFSHKSWNWETCEIAFAEANQYFYNSIYTSTPRICIQDWFKQGKSAIQDDSHMKNLYNSQKFYLNRFSKYYNEIDLSGMSYIMSLGGSCDAAHQLKIKGFNYYTYFFDYLWNELDGLKTVNQIIKNDFLYFDDHENYIRKKIPILDNKTYDLNKYYPNLIFYHYDTTKLEILKSFQRKIIRTRNFLKNSQYKIFIYYRHYHWSINPCSDLNILIEESCDFCNMYKNQFNNNFHLISLIVYDSEISHDQINKEVSYLKTFEDKNLKFDYVYRRDDINLNKKYKYYQSSWDKILKICEK